MGLAYFTAGDYVVIGNEQFEIIRPLGQGSYKQVFQARKLYCQEHCDVAVGAHLILDDFFKSYAPQLNQKVLDGASTPHLRREYPLVRAQVAGLPGETYVSVMELAAGDLDHFRHNLLPSSFRLLMQDAYQAAQEMEKLGAVNTDIKPKNLMIMGREISNKAIANGQAYLAFADQDVLQKVASKVTNPNLLAMTPAFAAPEYNVIDTVFSNKSSLWQISLSFYQALTGEKAFNSAAFSLFKYYYEDDETRVKMIKKMHKDGIKEITKKIDGIIEKFKKLGLKKEVEALKELKIIILNGLQLDPQKRLYSPKGVTLGPRPLHSTTKRLTVAPEAIITSYSQINKRQMAKLIDESSQLRRGAMAKDKTPNCTPGPLIKQTRSLLDFL